MALFAENGILGFNRIFQDIGKFAMFCTDLIEYKMHIFTGIIIMLNLYR